MDGLIYRVNCTHTGQQWLGLADHLATKITLKTSWILNHLTDSNRSVQTKALFLSGHRNTSWTLLSLFGPASFTVLVAIVA